MSKHTPTPWGYRSGEVYANDGDVNPVIAYIERDTTSDEQADADGELIVRAVNSHAALVEALELFMEWASGRDPAPHIPAATMAQARAALKLAKES